MSNCADCKGLKHKELLERSLSCQPSDYYEPRDIYFCPHQMRWLIQNIQALHQFRWVTNLEIALPKRQKPGGKGYFETPADYAYEVERRLEHCGKDGLITYLFLGYDFSAEQLARFHHLREQGIKYRIEVVVWHISGWNYYAEYPYRWDNVIRNYQNWKSQLGIGAAGSSVDSSNSRL